MIASFGAILVYHYAVAPSQNLEAFGTLEARNIRVGSKTGGRITQVLAQEGDAVTKNQLLVVFDDDELKAVLLQAQGKLAQARANLDKLRHGSRSEDIAESQAAAISAPDRPGFRLEELASARADLHRAQTETVNAEREFRRMQQLRQRNVISTQELDQVRTRYETAQAQVNSLSHAVSAAEGRLRAARAAMERTENGSRVEDVAAAEAACQIAEGELRQAEARWAEHEVRAPADAIVEVLDLRPGHLLPAPALVAQLLEAEQIYVMVYVPESQLGRIRLGQTAEVGVDAYPDRVFPATVAQIRQQAEFLPRNVQTRDERVHQVIGIKLRIPNPDHLLRAGLHAEVRFLPASS